MLEEKPIPPVMTTTRNAAARQVVLNLSLKMSASLVAAILLLSFGIAVSFWSFKQIEVAAEARKHVILVINQANTVLINMLDAETGKRGYLLTRDESYLAPYLAAQHDVLPNLKTLRQQSTISAAQAHLDLLVPMITRKLAEMAEVIALQRKHQDVITQSLAKISEGKHLMDTIRSEMQGFIQLQEMAAEKQDALFQVNMRHQFAIIVSTSLFALLFAVWFAILIFRAGQQKLKDVIHLETQNLLKQQEETNQQLLNTNLNLQLSEERLYVTLRSIGDAVIATDALARVTLLNPLAEKLTGWTQAQAMGLPVGDIFHIINQDTRIEATIPVMEALKHGTVQGLANHTILIAKSGSECSIADSCAPIRNLDGKEVGAVQVFRDVTAEHAVQQSLRDSNTLVKTILGTVADGIITLEACSGLIDTVNPATERMFGYSAQELIGQPISFLIPELEAERCNLCLDYHDSQSDNHECEMLGRRKNSEEFAVDMTLTEMYLGGQRFFTGILRDISVRKAVESALKESEVLKLTVLNSLDAEIAVIDLNGVIMDINAPWRNFALENNIESSRPLLNFNVGDDYLAFYDDNTDFRSTEVIAAYQGVRGVLEGSLPCFKLEYQCHTPTQQRWYSMSVTPLTKGVRSGAVISHTDITDFKTLDQVLQAKNSELEIAKSVAEKANRAKSEFLSSMSHELRTPLNAILGFAQLLEVGKPAPTESQLLRVQQIIKAGWYLLELINEVLDLALIESGKLTLSLEPVLLNNVILECLAMVEPQAQQHQIKLSFLPVDPNWIVNSDHIRIKQVLINLLSNAIKYNRDQGTVDIKCSTDMPGFIRISVKDSGVGLSLEKLQQLFQPFNRLGQEHGKEEGTGIGLVVTKRLVELMQGTIGVESQSGEGCEFWINLHRVNAPHSMTEKMPIVDVHQQNYANSAMRTLLYVEDNPANMLLVEEIIADYPEIKLLSAYDGSSGLELARAHRPDVILMDINLPGINGIKVMQRLKEDPITAKIPVIALSANAMTRDIEKGLQAGFFRYLTKPIRVNEFMQALDDALNDSDHLLDTYNGR